MNRQGHITTYLLVFILIVIGVLVFIFRDDLFSQAEQYLIDEPVVTGVTRPSEDLIDPAIFTDDRLIELKRQVPYFNFNRLGRSLPPGLESSNLPIFAPVYLGNNQPLR